MGEAAVLEGAGSEADLDSAPLEHLEREMMSMAGHIAAATALWLRWLAVYDRRKGYEGWGCRSSAEWLNMRCGMSLTTGREKVRLARALEGLALIRAATEAGELSYSKARALTRVANADNETDSLSLALDSTAGQLDRIVAGVLLSKRRADSDADAEAAFAERRVNSRSPGDATMTISATVPVEMGEQILGGIGARVDRIIEDVSLPGQPRREVIEARGGLAALRADALGDLACGHGDEFVPAAVSVVVTAEAVTVEGTAVASPVGERVLCDANVETVFVQGEGSAHSEGRQARAPGRGTRRALLRRDHGMCRSPGCGATRRLHAHHGVHRSHGGPTELANLMMVCPFHHHMLHEGGWHARSMGGGGFEFVMPNGQTLAIARSRGSVAQLVACHGVRGIGPRTIEPRSASRLVELSWLTSNFIHNEANHRKRRTDSQP